MNFKFCLLFQGHHLKLATLPSKPYVNDMTPTGLSADGSIKYEMTGMFAEIFNNLQVSFINHILAASCRLWFLISTYPKNQIAKNTMTDFIKICGIILYLELIPYI